MKITYPECQVEITAEELITVIDHFTTKATHHHEPTFEPGGIVGTGDDMPEPKPYPQSGETVIPNMAEVETFLSSAIRRFFGSQEKRQWMEDKLTEQGLQRIVDCENTLEDAINGGDTVDTKAALAGLDEAWLHAEKEIPNEPAPTESKKEPAKPKRKTNSKKVQVLFETGWKTFNSISQAAKAIDARLNHLSHALLNGKTCNGHQVRYADPELDASLAEIKERDKQPYQPSKPVR